MNFYLIKKIVKKFLPNFLLNYYHYFLAFLSACYFGFPSRRLVVIGITGTKGKTTATELANRFLEAYGYKTALINSLRFKINKESWPNNLKMTMPGRFFIQKFLAKALKNHCTHAILEVTSEGIKQFRHKFIDFDIAVLVNLQPEHLEAHDGSFEKYRQAKEKLFRSLKSKRKKLVFGDGLRGHFDTYLKKTAVINLDEEVAPYFLKHFAEKRIGFSLEKKEGPVDLLIAPQQYQLSSQGINFVLEKIDFYSPLKGKFNLENILTAIAIGRALDIPFNLMREELKNFSGLPGRLEEIQTGQSFRVFVDFAHTPDSLEAVYQTLKENFLLPQSRLICVLGATGGGRDRWKRPIMGKIAGLYCDEIIITNEDPYDEEPRKIMEEIAVGLDSENKSYRIIEDRREAIAFALKLARKDDCVIITGKGAEQIMVLKNNQKIPWDDRAVVKEELEKLKNEKKNPF